MSELKRITPEELLLAYEKTGLKPAFGSWRNESENCACGFGAISLATAEGELLERLNEQFNRPSLDGIVAILEQMGYKEQYIRGFILGFDGDCKWDYEIGNKKIGYQDGLNCRIAVHERFEKDEIFDFTFYKKVIE